PDLIVVTAPAIFRRRCRFTTSTALLCYLPALVAVNALGLALGHRNMDDLSINTAPALRLLGWATMFGRFFPGSVALATPFLASRYTDLKDLSVIAAPTLRRRLRRRRRSSGRTTMPERFFF